MQLRIKMQQQPIINGWVLIKAAGNKKSSTYRINYFNLLFPIPTKKAE